MRSLVFAAILSSWAVPALAQNPAVSLTLADAISEALVRNPELVVLRQDAELAQSRPGLERFLAPPMLEAQIWGWPVTTLNPARTDMYMLMAEQQLPGKGKRAARALVLEREADVVNQQVAVRAAQIAGEVRTAFIELASTRSTFELYTRQSAVLSDIAETATLRYASGEGAQHHTVVALVEIAEVEKARIEAEESAAAAEARLNTLLGRPPSQPVEALAPATVRLTAGQAEQRALTSHPDIAMIEAAVAREEAELARLRNERRPDFVIGGGYMLMPGGAGAWTARGGITWPNAPWSRDRFTAETDLQGRRVEAVKARRAVVEAQLRGTIQEAVIRVTAAERQVRLLESTVRPQLEHAFELTRLAYTTGEGSFTEMLETRRMLLTTELQLIEARADAVRAMAALETAAGVL